MPVTIKNQAGRSAQIAVSGEIGGPTGITAGEFQSIVETLGPLDKLLVSINSPGGDAFEGLAIYNLLTSMGAEVTTRNDALAASAASIVLMAGDRILTYENSMTMIHNAWTLAMGNSDELRHTAELLSKIDKQMIAIYARQTGLSPAKIAAMMAVETWMDANEARAQGFIDEVLSTSSGTKASVPPGRFKNAPRDLLAPGSRRFEEASRKAAWGRRLAEIQKRQDEIAQTLKG